MGAEACVCACALNCVFAAGCAGGLEVSMSVLPPLASCPARKGVASKLPPDALRCRGG